MPESNLTQSAIYKINRSWFVRKFDIRRRVAGISFCMHIHPWIHARRGYLFYGDTYDAIILPIQRIHKRSEPLLCFIRVRIIARELIFVYSDCCVLEKLEESVLFFGLKT